MIENAREAILGVDEGVRITIANPAAERMFGYDRKELAGLALRELIPERWRERHEEAHRSYFDDPGARRMGTRRELTGRRKYGSEVALEISLRHIRTTGGPTAIAFLLDVTERTEYRRELQALARQLMTAQEEERRRMARDLHDDLTQSISFIGMELGFLERQADGPRQRLVEGIGNLRRLVDSVVEEVRAISHRRHPTSLEYSGLGPALESLEAEAGKHGGPAVRVEAGDGTESLSREQATALYQIAHEALRNATRHGRATAVKVRIGTTNDGIRMTISDDGEGFDPERVRPGAGLGTVVAVTLPLVR